MVVCVSNCQGSEPRWLITISSVTYNSSTKRDKNQVAGRFLAEIRLDLGVEFFDVLKLGFSPSSAADSLPTGRQAPQSQAF